MKYMLPRNSAGGATKVLILLLALIIAACTIKLAPDYDQSIVDGLGKVNDSGQKLFAAIGQGSSQSDYAKHQATYIQLIGQLDALQLQALSRPEPPPPAVFAWLSSSNPADQPPRLKTPTTQHRNAGLVVDDVTDFKESLRRT
jgi:hypothetical protein